VIQPGFVHGHQSRQEIIWIAPKKIPEVAHTTAQWARIPKKLAKNRFYDIKQLRRNPLPFVLTSSLVMAHAWTSLCLHIGHVCTAG